LTSRVHVIIACHNPARPIGRAVDSIVNGNLKNVDLTVVSHNIAADRIRAEVSADSAAHVNFVEFHDGIRSATGPFEHGMDMGDYEFVSIMGSDDWLEPGAVATWLRLADEQQADVVVTRLLRGGKVTPTPPVRPTLRGRADPVKDRLSYRSAPLGLVSTAVRKRTGARLVSHPVGGDVPYVTQLWFESNVAVQRSGPGYVIGEDAEDRVTYVDRDIAIELQFLETLINSSWFAHRSATERRAIVSKLIRIHLFGVLLNRPSAQWWTDEQRMALARITERLLSAAPGVADRLSIADNRVLEAIRSRSIPAEELIDRAHARRRHGRPLTVLPANPRYVLAREAPLRFMAASLLVR